MKYNWLLDNGHGGILNGKYTTYPKKMHKFSDGTVIYEGDFNRKVVKKISDKLRVFGVKHVILTPELEDVPLSVRVKKADDYYALDKSSVFCSVHGNGGGGHGFEIYTSVGQTRSDKIAQVFFDEMVREFPNKVARKDNRDGDDDKEANFYVLRKTDCPALLTENFFMDTYEDALLMLSDEGQEKIAQAHVNAILRIEDSNVKF